MQPTHDAGRVYTRETRTEIEENINGVAQRGEARVMSASDAKRRIGRATWTVIHSYPYSIHRDGDASPENVYVRVLKYIMLVELLFDLYPCEKCRQHLEAFRSTILDALCIPLAPLATSTRCEVKPTIDTIVIWAFHLHNMVTLRVRDTGEQPDTSENEYFVAMETTHAPEEVLGILDVMYNIVY